MSLSPQSQPDDENDVDANASPDDDDSLEDEAELQESAESIRREILRLNSEAESLARDLN